MRLSFSRPATGVLALVLGLATGCKRQLLAVDDPSWDRCPTSTPTAIPARDSSATSSRDTAKTVHIMIDGPGSFSRHSTPAIWIVDGRVARREGDVGELDASTIESVIVLKDEEARRRFGVCKGVGVVLVTTKAAAGKR